MAVQNFLAINRKDMDMIGMEGNEEPPCGGDEAKALREIEEAKAEMGEAKEEIRHGLSLEEKAVRHLEEAEADLERARRVVHIKVDGEEYETERHEMTPDEIIREFGGKTDVATYYLVELAKPQNVSFQGQGGVPIRLHDGLCLMVMSIGPATVSDPGSLVGVQAFISGLKALGYEPMQMPEDANRVYFDYVVPAGSKEGMKVRIGLMVPCDFPMTPPSGPFVSPHIHPISGSGGVHPTGGIHRGSFTQFDGAGGEWQYWSRPFIDWRASKKTVAAYLAHVLKLWATQ